jgi:hypothetical protein
MFEQAVLTSEAFRQGAPQMQGTLRMAMKGCLRCGTRQMIASPVLGTCEDCGSELQIINE